MTLYQYVKISRRKIYLSYTKLISLYTQNSDDQTMQFSYIIAATRPAGGFLLTTLFLLLLTPLIEQTTQIPIRATLLSGITGQSISDAAQAFQASSDPMGVFSK